MFESTNTLWSRSGSGFRQAALAGTVLVAAVLIALSALGLDVHTVNPSLVLLLLTLLISATFGFRAGLVAALLSNPLVTFFFLQPLHQFGAEDPQELASLPVFLLASAIGSSLLQTYRLLAESARKGQAQAEALLSLNRAIIGQTDPHATLDELAGQLVLTFAAKGAAVLAFNGSDWSVMSAAGDANAGRDVSRLEASQANQAMSTGAVRRLDLPVEVIFVPLSSADRRLGALRIDGPLGDTPFQQDPSELLTAFAGEAALAIGRIELAQAARETEALKQADAMKTAILNSISHDLKTPLATIKAATSSLLEPTVPWSSGDQAAFLNSIEQESDRLDRTISELLDLNRLQANAVRPLLQDELLSEIVESAIEVMSKVLEERRVTVDVPEIVVHTDGALLRRALANLLENAAIHSRQDGAIFVAARIEEGLVRLSVQDEGPGVDAADLTKIFEPFYKAGDRPVKVKGSGLGLAIVKGFVTLCGGTVVAESDESCTCFVISLPGLAVPAPRRVLA